MVYDVAVVGAGPAGSMAAYTSARAGLKTLLLEEHSEVGRPPHCTGKLTAHAFQDFDLPRKTILNSVRAAVLYSPGNHELRIRRHEVDSYIIDRVLFDRILADKAVSAGAELTPETRIQGAYRSVDHLLNLKARTTGATKEFQTRLLIDAEGAKAGLLKDFGLTTRRKNLIGLQYEMTNVSLPSLDTVELYFGQQTAPGFFAWIVPLDDDRVRAGLCVEEGPTRDSVLDYLKRFVQEHPVASCKLTGGKIQQLYGGSIPSGLLDRSFADGLLVVGDCAGHVKATTGGGVYFALKAAQAAGKTAVEAQAAGRFDRSFLGKYETAWRSLIGDELRFTSLARKTLNRLTDEDLDRLFRLMTENELVETVEAYGDTALQSKLLRPMLKKLAEASVKRKANLLFLSRILAKTFWASFT